MTTRPNASDTERSRSAAERWAHERALVEHALALAPGARPAFLDASCRDDDALRQRVERLVAAYERTGEDSGFLARPAGALVGPLLVAALHGPAADLLARLNRAIGDRYTLEGELGTGGMATVFRAYDVRHARQVAIKVMHPELSALLGADRFLSEIRTTAALQHPNILPLFDSGSVPTGQPESGAETAAAAGGGAGPSLLYYVMPLVEGETLRARLTREQQLPVSDAVRIASEVADALDYAHRRGVIHRDIKPENILLHEGRPVIADFGIALAVQSAEPKRTTQPGLTLGTPQYMSPEQTTGEQDITARSDVYALGAVTYEMLAGAPPFTGETVQQIATRVRVEEPRAISTHRKGVPRNVNAAVLVALEKLPADRFESASAFARALSDPEFRGRSRVRAAARWRSERQRHRTFVAALLGVALVLAAAAGWQWLRPAQAAGNVVRFTMALPRDVSIVTTVPAGNIAISPNGQLIVFVGNAADGTRHLYARALDDIVPRPLAGTAGATQAFFSPDGRWIGFWSGGKIRKLAVDGGPPELLTSAPVFDGATWTRGGFIVYVSGHRLYSVPSTGGVGTLLAAPDREKGETEYLLPVAHPDGDHVLFSVGGSDGAMIGIASVSTRTATSLHIAGAMALGMIDDRVIYAARDNSIRAVPVDVALGRTTGAAVPVATDVSVNVTGSSNAALSASGTLAYRRVTRGSRLVLTNGRDPVRVVLGDGRTYAFPRFSPDGKQIAVSIDNGTRSDVWLYGGQSKTMTRLSLGGTANDRPEWTADGMRVLYRAEVAGRMGIWWRPADLSTPAVPLLTSATRGYFEAVASPDRHSLVYQVDNNVEARALAGDTTPRVVAATEYIENQARISPDGRWIAFMTNESGSDQIVVQPFSGPGARVQVSSNGGIEPVWSRDGKRLFYRTNNKFMVATVTTLPTFAVTSREVFADDRFLLATAPHANYDVSPDGTSLLVLEGIDDPSILIVQNWATEVRQRLSARGAALPRDH